MCVCVCYHTFLAGKMHWYVLVEQTLFTNSELGLATTFDFIIGMKSKGA